MLDEILTVQEVADYLRVSRTTVWRWCSQGKLPAFKAGRGWRVRRSEIEQMMTEGVASDEREAERVEDYEEKEADRPELVIEPNSWTI